MSYSYSRFELDSMYSFAFGCQCIFATQNENYISQPIVRHSEPRSDVHDDYIRIGRNEAVGDETAIATWRFFFIHNYKRTATLRVERQRVSRSEQMALLRQRTKEQRKGGC